MRVDLIRLSTNCRAIIVRPLHLRPTLDMSYGGYINEPMHNQPADPRTTALGVDQQKTHVVNIALALIEPDPDQPRRDWSGVYEPTMYDSAGVDPDAPTDIVMLQRREVGFEYIERLAQSIARYGVLQPITVRPHPRKASQGRYMIITGERRYHAARRAGLTYIAATIRDDGNYQIKLIQLVENMQRQDLTHVDQARAFYALQAAGVTAADIAAAIGMTGQYVRDHLRLLRYPCLVTAVEAGTIAFSVARDIMRLPDDLAEQVTAEVVAGKRYEGGDIGALRASLRADGTPHRKDEVTDKFGVKSNAGRLQGLHDPLPLASAVPVPDALAAIVARLDGPARAMLGEVVACAARHEWTCAQLATSLRLLL